MWETSDMSKSDQLKGKRLYDALVALKPAHLAETEWAAQAGLNRGFFSNLKGKGAASPRLSSIQQLLKIVGKTEADLNPDAPEAPQAGGRLPPPLVKSDHAPTRSVDSGETASVTRLDLSFSMGPGRDLDDSYVDGEAFEFDIGFLRSMTITPAERLRIVDGIGDSMQPTLHDRDLLFIDMNQATLNSQDRIWAIWLFGLGAVKRLRAIDETHVLVMSDNPDVENQVVERQHIIIHGRVVGSIKRH